MPERLYTDWRRRTRAAYNMTKYAAAKAALIGRTLASTNPIESCTNTVGTVDAATPRELDVHLILDNYGTHKTSLIPRWLVQHPRYHSHFTPTGSSWINLVERWFATLTERQLCRAAHRSTRELEQALRHYLETYNQDAKPFVWTKTADEILAAVAGFCKRTDDSGH